MSKPEDFVIEIGVLKKYVGTDTEVVIPDGVTSIGDDAFNYCKNCTIHCPENSAAHKYALKNNIKFKLIEV